MTNTPQDGNIHSLKGNPLNKYTILEKHLEGSTAKVFKVMNDKGEIFCLKVYYDDEEIFPGDINLKESHLLHTDIPTLAKVYEVDKYVEDGKEVHYSIMEYVNGIPLYEFIKTKKYNTDFVKSLANKLYKANDLMLERNLAHRDITTSNVLITSSGDCMLIDFGMISDTHTDDLTELEKEFWNDELKEILGNTKPLDKETLPKYWRIITLFEIRRVIHDVIVKKRKLNVRDIKIYINLDYEIRMLITNNNKAFAILHVLKQLVKLSRRIMFKMVYFQK